ncbi:MAG: phospholipase [Ardenticatenaceae bacterium]|nr:hypothetical protein [Anaerolineales bacterium]MCB8921580.1 phospholipase [Ardenticatenaceae bacterium]MCB9003883.1 phospholipase [Ardenticatenaceae bacterium]
MARKKKSAEQARLNQIVTIVLVVGFVGLGLYYLFTGSDPLGMFSQETVTETGVSPQVTTANGDWWEVYFTDPNNINNPDDLRGSIPEKLIDYINGAQESIHIASFEMNLTPVAEALVAAHQRGVDVRFVTDDENGIEADEEEGHGQFAMLEDAGIPVHDDERSALMHNKFWIFDGETVWTGSTNITVNGNFRNNNNVLVLHSPVVAAMFEQEFNEMWAGEFGPRSPSTVAQQSVVIDGTAVDVLFAAEDDAISHLVPLLEGAQESIEFMAFSFTHDELGTAVSDRAAAGVNVRGIFETRGSETEYSELPRLYCEGLDVRQDGNPGTFHHKVFIIDGETVVTGSLNFSENADESNDENVVIIHDAEIAALYQQEFARRWAEATVPDTADMGCK